MEEYLIIDAHAHLWQRATNPEVQPIPSNPSRSMFFGEERQMLPPFMIDGSNTAEVFLSNMDYAQVSAAVIVQEIIDGNQDEYLSTVQAHYPNRFFCCSLLTDPHTLPSTLYSLKGIALPGHRVKESLHTFLPIFKQMESNKQILSLCLADDEHQISEMQEIIQECPNLKVAIGHFGMPTTPSWRSQILLARNKNVMIESGGITWLFNYNGFPFPDATDHIRMAADMVGMDKLMWGSDYPRTITAITYKMAYDFIFHSDKFTHEEKKQFLGHNALRFYQFNENKFPELQYIKNMSE